MNNRKSLLCRIAIVDGFIKQLEGIKGKSSIPNHEINLGLSDLGISKQNLLDQLSKVDVMAQFASVPWVIKQNNTHPTYYQLISIEDRGIGKNNQNVTLARKGFTRIITYGAFVKEYRQATEEEVIQHIEFLNRTNGKFIRSSNPPSLDKMPIIDFSGGDSDLYKSIESAPKKSADADFYAVTLKQGRGCTKYHDTYEQAETEAIRLSKLEQKKAYVMGVVGEIEVIPTTVYDLKIQKY